MLDTLLESKSHRSRGKGTALASAAFHAAIILAAAYATASGASRHVAPDMPERLHYVPSPRPIEPVAHQQPRVRAAAPANPVLAAPTLHAPVSVPVDLPPIDPTRSIVDPKDFERLSHGSANSSAIPGNPVGGDSGTPVYDVTQVDTQVSPLGTTRPDYPAQLRSAGVEGQVVVQFVVTEAGRVDREGVRIISASNDVFAASVINALARMRFTPARIGDHAVPQLVQQLFAFKLDR